MRRVLVDYARGRNRAKRGGGRTAAPIQEVEEWLTAEERGEILELNEALERLKSLDVRASEVIELRFFGGLSLEETAEVMGVSVATVRRIWTAARAWLHKEIKKNILL
jgi:RNA polymerase sigma factor (TIGR02999 family)